MALFLLVWRGLRFVCVDLKSHIRKACTLAKPQLNLIAIVYIAVCASTTACTQLATGCRQTWVHGQRALGAVQFMLATFRFFLVLALLALESMVCVLLSRVCVLSPVHTVVGPDSWGYPQSCYVRCPETGTQ